MIEGINRVGALFYGPLLAAFMCGMLDRRATGPSVRAGLAAGLGVNLLLLMLFGRSLFWMWWNVSGLVVATCTCALLARAFPSPRTVPTTRGLLGATSIARQLVDVRRWALAMVVYTSGVIGILAWLGDISPS